MTVTQLFALIGVAAGILALVISNRQRRITEKGSCRCRGLAEIASGELTLRLTLDGAAAHVTRHKEAAPPDTPAAETKPDEAPPAAVDRRVVIDVLTLRAMFDYVMQHDNGKPGRGDFKEVFAYCSGVVADAQTFVVSHILEVAFSEQSAGGVRVADDSNIATLAALDDVGMPLICHVHSHPTFGPGGTTPSAIDRSFQARLESGGHRAIGAIFSRDAFVRFFAGEDSTFTVDVQGNGVEKVDDNVFQLRLGDRSIPLRVRGKRRK